MGQATIYALCRGESENKKKHVAALVRYCFNV